MAEVMRASWAGAVPFARVDPLMEMSVYCNDGRKWRGARTASTEAIQVEALTGGAALAMYVVIPVLMDVEQGDPRLDLQRRRTLVDRDRVT
jgi:hypothetical protein